MEDLAMRILAAFAALAAALSATGSWVNTGLADDSIHCGEQE